MSKRTWTLIGGVVALTGYVLAATLLKGSGYEAEVIAMLAYVGGSVGFGTRGKVKP